MKFPFQRCIALRPQKSTSFSPSGGDGRVPNDSLIILNLDVGTKGPLTCLAPLGGRQAEPRWSNLAEVVCPSPVLLGQLLAVAKQDRVLNGDRHDHAKPDPRSSLAGWRSDAARFYMAPLKHPPSIILRSQHNRRVSLGGRCGRGKTGS
jgi:hypothetical protein